ncbi:hypothetical protein P3T37_002704 [Kitasatospora sp. MAA4]|uniref:hypothetical protein n=1 Tax=Kitasatospora sp. MAA4 TaxID=3035093 RepID=UPI00247651A4|nr:hypothetical protein [Kitasatospora sp. MAA4]MDH6133309.1 hypothetical protein [Kitasatospora sp. MAA4]
MNATQQHMLDVHRAAQHRTLPPPAPGAGDWPGWWRAARALLGTTRDYEWSRTRERKR